ncbi:ribosome biogenesis factor YjgA [Desulfofustis limnaeus]|uniref:DUF615 domain-containing protein n=1 Tax=Desulfofustis limnaeus TaxID=2740163 RepID=A0ABM7W927_9BACT|nr:ribosome biogenesis factor YjgA [Desulfofustis limnaeus]MDX9896753.1 ribosome biogenesis factor YjgA [Desulfofustis sp.]BDD87432.1 hypothetical protein DPPLL_17970 [Desulfofustis limnaeus]
MAEISRSEQKRLLKQVEATARECLELSETEVGRLGLDDQLREALAVCRSIDGGGALKRQIKYVAKLLRSEDLPAIQRFLREKKGSKLDADRLFHDAEQWRDRIVNDAISSLEAHRRREEPWPTNWSSAAIDEVMVSFPDLDEHDLRQNAHHYARSRKKMYYRELFRIVRAAAEKQRQRETLAEQGVLQRVNTP